MKTLGFGLGLRPDHYDAILSERPSVGFFEAITENYELRRLSIVGNERMGVSARAQQALGLSAAARCE
jgi:uncharacterized protein (UPF0276 family)